ncbi:MAG: hypothetical protein Q8Q60_00135 [Candidatus Chromulinivorax sp.]|nr:hypothetical protein [Candidatus Chromulinivorax sp.]
MKNNASKKLLLSLLFLTHVSAYGDMPYPNYKYRDNYTYTPSVSHAPNYSYTNNSMMTLMMLAMVAYYYEQEKAAQAQKEGNADQPLAQTETQVQDDHGNDAENQKASDVQESSEIVVEDGDDC